MLRGLNNVVERKTKMLVEVISGMQIPQKLSGDKDIVDPYVTVHLISTSSPTTETLIVKTAVVKNNGLNPIWQVKSKEVTVIEDEINMLVFRVYDDDDTLLCLNVIPVVSLRSGYGAVDMKSPSTLKQLPATALLCKFNLSPQ